MPPELRISQHLSTRQSDIFKILYIQITEIYIRKITTRSEIYLYINDSDVLLLGNGRYDFLINSPHEF